MNARDRKYARVSDPKMEQLAGLDTHSYHLSPAETIREVLSLNSAVDFPCVMCGPARQVSCWRACEKPWPPPSFSTQALALTK
jgi:hypothetical protein